MNTRERLLEMADDNLIGLVQLWNRFCSESCDGSLDDYVWMSVEDFCNDIGHSYSAFDLIKMTHFGKLKGLNDYVYLDGYCNLKGFNHFLGSQIDLELLEDWIDAESIEF